MEERYGSSEIWSDALLYIYLKLNRSNISEFKKLEKGSYKREL